MKSGRANNVELREALEEFGYAAACFKVLEQCSTLQELEAREQHWSEKYPRFNKNPINRKSVERQAASMREIHARNRVERAKDPAYREQLRAGAELLKARAVWRKDVMDRRRRRLEEKVLRARGLFRTALHNLRTDKALYKT